MNFQKTYTVEDKSITAQVNQIKRIIRGSMNGVTVESMEQKGIHYKENYGVALPRLQEIAKQYEPNLQLATQLWFLGIRESMIVGSLLVPINEITTEMAIKWCEQIPTNELSEIAAMTLFSRLPNAPNLIEKLVNHTSEFVFLTSIATATRITEQLSDKLIEQLVARYNDAKDSTFTVAQAMATLLSRVASDQQTRLALVGNLTSQFAEREAPYARFIFEYVTKELEYLKQI